MLFAKETLPIEHVDWRLFRRKTDTKMVRVAGPFEVETTEGVMKCEDGWLALDSRGELYPIAAEEQAAIYDEITGRKIRTPKPAPKMSY